MVKQIALVVLITVLQWRFTGFTIALFFSLLARFLFIARFQGLKVAQNTMFTIEGLGLGIHIGISAMFKNTTIVNILIIILINAVFIIQVLIEINTKVSISIPLEEYNALMEAYQEEKKEDTYE